MFGQSQYDTAVKGTLTTIVAIRAVSGLGLIHVKVRRRNLNYICKNLNIKAKADT